jgi:hypothetical protein
MRRGTDHKKKAELQNISPQRMVNEIKMEFG